MEHLVQLIWITVWITGAVLASGFWSTLAAVLTGGLWSAYLIIELVLQHYHLIGANL